MEYDKHTKGRGGRVYMYTEKELLEKASKMSFRNREMVEKSGQ